MFPGTNRFCSTTGARTPCRAAMEPARKHAFGTALIGPLSQDADQDEHSRAPLSLITPNHRHAPNEIPGGVPYPPPSRAYTGFYRSRTSDLRTTRTVG